MTGANPRTEGTREPAPYRVLVTGSRNWEDRAAIDDFLTALAAANTFHDRTTLIVHGACPTGADAMADDWARWHANRSPLIKVERHPADWAQHGLAAGPIRNQHMANLGADLCLAFIHNGSRGASHTARIAEAAGMSVSTSVGTTASRSFGTTLEPADDRSPEALTASSRWLRLCNSP